MISLKAGCKINLALKITGKLADGYHTLESVFFPLDEPYDALHIKKLPDSVFRLRCSMPLAGVNSLEKAWRNFSVACGNKIGVEITLEKGIPAGSGLGGASSDAAALLKWLNANLPEPLGFAELSAIAKKTGADTPFFLLNRPALIGGIGETITPLAHWPEFWLLLLWPGIALSTREVFQTFDRLEQAGSGLTKPAVTDKSLFHNSWRQELPAGFNSLERAATLLCPQLAAVKADLARQNPACYGMSGSGSSYFAIFASATQAEQAKRGLQAKYRHIWLCRYKGSEKLPAKEA